MPTDIYVQNGKLYMRLSKAELPTWWYNIDIWRRRCAKHDFILPNQALYLLLVSRNCRKASNGTSWFISEARETYLSNSWLLPYFYHTPKALPTLPSTPTLQSSLPPTQDEAYYPTPPCPPYISNLILHLAITQYQYRYLPQPKQPPWPQQAAKARRIRLLQ